MSDFNNVIDKFQLALLAARPRDVLKFSVRYFGDEKCSDPEEAHAIHVLPFVIFDSEAFGNAACTIFCRNLFSSNSVMNGVSSNNVRGYLDGETVRDVIGRINLEGLRLRISVIDDVIDDLLKQLKRVDFDLFIACLRLPLTCYQVALWAQDELRKCRISDEVDYSSFSTNSSSCNPYGVVDLSKVQAHLQRSGTNSKHSRSALIGNTASNEVIDTRSASVTAIRLGSAYHMHAHTWTEAELRLFTKLLSAAVEDRIEEESGTKYVSASSLVEEFMVKYMKKACATVSIDSLATAGDRM